MKIEIFSLIYDIEDVDFPIKESVSVLRKDIVKYVIKHSTDVFDLLEWALENGTRNQCALVISGVGHMAIAARELIFKINNKYKFAIFDPIDYTGMMAGKAHMALIIQKRANAIFYESESEQ